MTAALVVLGVVASLIVLALFGWLDCDDAEAQVRAERVRIEAAIEDDHEAARRAMNDAAGQSWRNVAE